MNIAREILEKHLNKDLDIKTYLKGSTLTYEVVLDAIEEAINYTHSCETLKGKETPTLKDAFIAGYKKRALMSGLKYDEVSELSAITNFKCWKSFDLNP